MAVSFSAASLASQRTTAAAPSLTARVANSLPSPMAAPVTKTLSPLTDCIMALPRGVFGEPVVLSVLPQQVRGSGGPKCGGWTIFGTSEHGRCLRFPRVSVLWSASANKPIGKLSKFMTAAATSALESRVGHYYQVDGTYQVGREKVREYARAVQDKHPAHWDPGAAAELGYSGVVAPLTFTSVPGMMANREMFESVVVGYDTYVQTEEVFEQHRPIVAGDELRVDVELSSVRRIAGRDLITVTNTFTDSAGERVHTLHTTVVGVTADDVDPAIKTIVQNAMMHDAYQLPIGKSESAYQKTVRPDAEIRIADGGTTRTPGTPDFDDVKVGDELSVHHARLSRGDLVNYSGVAGDANPIHWDEDIAKAGGPAGCDRPWDAHHGSGCRIRLGMVGRPRCGYPLRGAAVPARDRVGCRGRRHRVERPDQVAGPGDPHRCRPCRGEVRWPKDLRLGDVERPLPLMRLDQATGRERTPENLTAVLTGAR